MLSIPEVSMCRTDKTLLCSRVSNLWVSISPYNAKTNAILRVPYYSHSIIHIPPNPILIIKAPALDWLWFRVFLQFGSASTAGGACAAEAARSC